MLALQFKLANCSSKKTQQTGVASLHNARMSEAGAGEQAEGAPNCAGFGVGTDAFGEGLEAVLGLGLVFLVGFVFFVGLPPLCAGAVGTGLPPLWTGATGFGLEPLRARTYMLSARHVSSNICQVRGL